jgi:hypothetical protein
VTLAWHALVVARATMLVTVSWMILIPRPVFVNDGPMELNVKFGVPMIAVLLGIVR